MSDLRDKAAAALRQNPSALAIEFEGHTYTWGSMRDVADALSRLLQSSGADPRGPIVFIARTRPSALAALLGLIVAGRNIQMVYPFQSASGLAKNIERLRPAVVVAASQDFSVPVRAAMRMQNAAAIVIEEMDATRLAGFESATTAFDSADAAVDPWIGVLTSGTTGPPKQFPITYKSLSKILMARLGTPSRDGAPMLLYFPVGNISGLYTYLPALLNAHRMILLDRFSLDAWRNYVRRYRPTTFGLPASAVQLVLDANVSKEELASVKHMSAGAAPLDPGVQRAFQDKYGIPILLSYGATEFAGTVTMMTPQLQEEWGDRKLGSVGRPFGETQLRVVDPETGAELVPGEEGLLEVISPHVGLDWIRTSDLGTVDEDGFVFICGRIDGAIIRGGFKLLPETIERALRLHPALSEVVVVGVPDRRLGQVPGAAVQCKPGIKPVTSDELSAHLRQHVLATQIPAYWRFVAELPRNASFKLDRRAVAEMFNETQSG